MTKGYRGTWQIDSTTGSNGMRHNGRSEGGHVDKS